MSSAVISKLSSVRFASARRGYDRNEVEAFLQGIINELADEATMKLLDRARPGTEGSVTPSLRARAERKEAASEGAEGPSSAPAPRAPEQAPSPAAHRGQELAAARVLREAEQEAASILADARDRARAIGAETEATSRQVKDAAARARADAMLDADRLRAAAAGSVRELITLARGGSSAELEQALNELERLSGVGSPTPSAGRPSPAPSPDPAPIADELGALERDLEARLDALGAGRLAA